VRCKGLIFLIIFFIFANCSVVRALADHLDTSAIDCTEITAWTIAGISGQRIEQPEARAIENIRK